MLYRKRLIEFTPGPPTLLDILWDENNRPIRHVETAIGFIVDRGEQVRINSGLWTLTRNKVVTFRNIEEVRRRTAKLVGSAIVNTDPELIEE